MPRRDVCTWVISTPKHCVLWLLSFCGLSYISLSLRSSINMPGILPMKVIKVGANAQTRIAQAWYSRAASRMPARLLTDSTATGAGPRRSAVMAFARTATKDD